jgi:hypothetical protein
MWRKKYCLWRSVVLENPKNPKSETNASGQKKRKRETAFGLSTTNPIYVVMTYKAQRRIIESFGFKD